MRKTIIGIGLALAACGKPADEAKKAPAPVTQEAPSRPAVEAAVAAPPVAAPLSAEEKTKAVATIEEKMKSLTELTGKLVEDLTRASSEAEREQLKLKLVHLSEERAALAQDLETAKR